MKTTETGGIPAFLKRETNAKGVTLSAGIDTQATATGAKTPSKAERKALERAAKDAAIAAKQAERAAAKTAKAAEPVVKSTPVTPAPVELDADGNPVKVKRSIVPMKFKERYKGHGGTCGDDMALELKAATTTRNADKRECLDWDALKAIAAANDIDWEKYATMNNGQKRMNVGNKLRGKLAAGVDVVVGTRTFKAEDFVPKH